MHVNGLVQERCSSIANALEYVFLALTHPYVGGVSWGTLVLTDKTDIGLSLCGPGVQTLYLIRYMKFYINDFQANLLIDS